MEIRSTTYDSDDQLYYIDDAEDPAPGYESVVIVAGRRAAVRALQQELDGVMPGTKLMAWKLCPSDLTAESNGIRLSPAAQKVSEEANAARKKK